MKMTLKDLLLKYEFDALVPDLILTDKPTKDNLYAFKEAFDELRRMKPGDPHGELIVVDIEVDTDDDDNEIERYLHASKPCSIGAVRKYESGQEALHKYNIVIWSYSLATIWQKSSLLLSHQRNGLSHEKRILAQGASMRKVCLSPF